MRHKRILAAVVSVLVLNVAAQPGTAMERRLAIPTVPNHGAFSEGVAVDRSEVDLEAFHRVALRMGLSPIPGTTCYGVDQWLSANDQLCFQYGLWAADRLDTIVRSLPWGVDSTVLLPGELYARYHLYAYRTNGPVFAERLSRYALSAYWQELYPQARADSLYVVVDMPSTGEILGHSAVSATWAWKDYSRRDPFSPGNGFVTGMMVLWDVLWVIPPIALAWNSKDARSAAGNVALGFALRESVLLVMPGFLFSADAVEHRRILRSGYRVPRTMSED